MSPLKSKRKSPTTKTKKPSFTLSDHLEKPSLPDDLVISILARVSRSFYTNLSLVSKSFRPILASPELYKTRTLLGCTETFLYVCLRFPHEANPRWFTLYRKKPNQTLTKKKKKTTKKEDSCVHLLAPTPILNSPPGEWSSLVAVGSNLYAITASIEDSPCSNVWFLDCRTHTWLEAPRMRLAHINSDFDGNMYLAGSSESPDSLSCVEVYNTTTQTWNPVPPKKRILEFGNMEGKIYLNLDVDSTTKENVALKPKDWTWETIGLDTHLGSVCMIDNVAFHYQPCVKIIWRKNKTKGAVWRRLEGLEGLPKFAKYSTVNLVDCGGKLVVLWDKYVRGSGYKEKLIWCPEISLEKRNNEEIWGKVEWFDAVLTVPKSYKFVCAKSVTV